MEEKLLEANPQQFHEQVYHHLLMDESIYWDHGALIKFECNFYRNIRNSTESNDHLLVQSYEIKKYLVFFSYKSYLALKNQTKIKPTTGERAIIKN